MLSGSAQTNKRHSSVSSRGLVFFLLAVVGLSMCYNILIWQQPQPQAPVPATTAAYNGDNNNPRTALPERLAEAVFVAVQLKRSQSYLQLQCPKDGGQHIGERPAEHTPPLVGTPCEAWQNRELLTVLWHFFDSTMVGVEWSSGSGTSWAVRRGLTLHSVEHCDMWLNDLGKLIKSLVPEEGKWTPYHVPRADGKGCDQNLDNDWSTMERIFGDYARYPRQHLLRTVAPPGGFDFVSVDGRFRDGCIVQAAALDDDPANQQPLLMNPQYGVLLLDNAERSIYQKLSELPSHWLVVSFANAVSETALWMVCPTVEDVHCERARRRIADYMARLPRHVVGSRYKAHMARAKADGVPGA